MPQNIDIFTFLKLKFKDDFLQVVYPETTCI